MHYIFIHDPCTKSVTYRRRLDHQTTFRFDFVLRRQRIYVRGTSIVNWFAKYLRHIQRCLECFLFGVEKKLCNLLSLIKHAIRTRLFTDKPDYAPQTKFETIDRLQTLVSSNPLVILISNHYIVTCTCNELPPHTLRNNLWVLFQVHLKEAGVSKFVGGWLTADVCQLQMQCLTKPNLQKHNFNTRWDIDR